MSFTKLGLSFFFFQISSLFLIFFMGLSLFGFFLSFSFFFGQHRRFASTCPELCFREWPENAFETFVQEEGKMFEASLNRCFKQLKTKKN